MFYKYFSELLMVSVRNLIVYILRKLLYPYLFLLHLPEPTYAALLHPI
jgi:hypothetical protein